MYETSTLFATQWIRNGSWDMEDYTTHFMCNTFVDHEREFLLEVPFRWVELQEEYEYEYR